MNTTIITVNSNYQIELVNESGNHYPQYRNCAGSWSYYQVGNKQKSFKTEKGARNYMAKQSAGASLIIEEQATEETTPEPIEEELTPEDMADLEEIMSEPVMGPYTTEELTQLLTQPEKPAVGTLVRLKGSLVGRQYRITRYYEDNYHFVCEMVNEPENADRTRVWNLDDVEVEPPEPASEQLAVQANLIAFFEAAYQYCYTQVSDYLPQPHEYIYGSHYRPINAVWARIPEAHYIQLDHKSKDWVYSWVVVPEPLDAKTLASYELELVRVPEAVLQAWNELLAVPSYCERKLADDRTMDELKHEIDIMRAEVAAKLVQV